MNCKLPLSLVPVHVAVLVCDGLLVLRQQRLVKSANSSWYIV